MEETCELESANREIALEDYRANLEEAAERLRFQTEFAQSALRNLQLVNGGAVLALLTFLGNTGREFSQVAIWWSFFWFGLGLTFGLFAYFGAYFSQGFYMQVTIQQAWNAQSKARGLGAVHDWNSYLKLGNGAIILAIGSAVLSLASFITGTFVALDAIT